MSTKTEHYQLNQWEPSDPFLRTDFNEDNVKIDAALAAKAEKTALSAGLAQKADAATVAALQTQVAAKCEVVFGSYTGDSETPTVAWRTISLGFTPRAVLVVMGGGSNGHILDNCGAQFALPGHKVVDLEIVEGGFRVWSRLNETNSNYNPYNYIAFR